jgi:ABC-type transport system involved in multi-copper enzyme maturation permease subunit
VGEPASESTTGPAGHTGRWAAPAARSGSATAILRPQARLLADSLRCRAVSALLVALMALAVATAAVRYGGGRMDQAAVGERYDLELRGATVARLTGMLHPAFKPPLATSFAADGGQAVTPNLYRLSISALEIPELARSRGGDDRLPSRQSLDWGFVLAVVLPLAAFLLAYDAICGERDSGTLKVLLSYPVSRPRLLTAKLGTAWICLAVPVAAGAALGLLLAFGAGGIPLAGDDLAKAALVTLLALWSAALYVLVALLVSSLTRDAATSLSVLAWIWVAMAIVLPAMSGLLAHRLLPVPSDGEIALRVSGVDAEIKRQYAGREGRWRSNEWARVDGYAWERTSAAIAWQRFERQQAIRRDFLDRKLAQARLARRIAAISPAALAGESAELLNGSGLERDESFLEQARRFRATLAARVAALDAADPASPHLLFFERYMSGRPVAPSALPRFRFVERPAGEGLAAARPRLAVLALETAALALACLAAFARSDAG